MTALQAGLATLPAAAGMILITPVITPLAVRFGAAIVIAVGFGLATAGFVVLVFIKASWEYLAIVGPLVAMAVGLGLSNGPASSGSTSAVPKDEVGQASGISNMARYVGSSVSVAAIAMLYNAVINNHLHDGESKANALAAGFSASALLLALVCAAGVPLALLMLRHRPQKQQAVHRAAAAAMPLHTIPTEPSPAT